MATGTTAGDNEFLFRLQTLLIDGGTGVLRNTFDERLQNQTLNVLLSKNKTFIDILLNRKVITRTQYGLLYPPKGQHPNSAAYDISLIICLLKNIPSLGLNRNYQWNTQPQPTDTSTEADLCRLKEFRNKVLLRLNGALINPDPNLKQTIEDYKNKSLDKSAEKRLRLVIETWQKMERDSDTKIQQVHIDVKKIASNVENVNTKMETIVSEIYIRKEKPTTQETIPEIQKYLIELYRKRHSSIFLSPLLGEDTPLLALYQMPNFCSVQVQWALGGGKEVKTLVEHFSDIFYKNNNDYREIYLIGDAGLGKTSFCRRLVLTWCQTKNPIQDEDKYFSPNELDTMKRFDAVFLLTLRNSVRECDVDKMIYYQIVRNLSSKHSLEDLENILSNKKCLVILDGLDEWTHPPIPCTQGLSYIPHRRARHWTVLTTARPWKLSGSTVKNSEIDQKLEISLFSQEEALMLKKSMLSHILQESDEVILNRHIQEFNDDLRKYGISSIERNPLILMYLLCLWCDKRKLGESLSELYSNIIELYLSRTVDKYMKKESELPVPPSSTEHEIPKCFIGHELCKRYYILLKNLSEIAFNSLNIEAKEEIRNRNLLEFCCDSGILTQSTIRGQLAEQETVISFAHETVQEFFAALYLHTNSDKVTVEKQIISHCKCIKDILEMSKVFIFLGGINVNVSSSISQELMNVVNGDKLTNIYRTLTHAFTREESSQPLKELQNMCISCLKENPDNKDLKVCLQDIFIDKDSMQEANFNHLQQLAIQNKENIKSVSIRIEGIPYNMQKIISDLELVDLSSVDKIYFKGPLGDCDITPLLHRSLKCLSLISSKWRDDRFTIEYVTWSPAFCNRVCSLDNLKAIHLNNIKMNHKLFVKLARYLSTTTSMLEILLINVLCTDHMTACPDSLLDLSQHDRLMMLHLKSIPLSAMELNVSSLEECYVGGLTTPGLTLKCLRYLSTARKLHTFICSGLDSEDTDGMLNTLSLLGQTENVFMYSITLRDRTLPIAEMKNINFVGLFFVKMTASTFHGLVDSVKNFPQGVTVYISECTVTPKEDFERQIESIKTSPNFTITFFSSKPTEKFLFKLIMYTCILKVFLKEFDI